MYHLPVMYNQCLDALVTDPNGTYVDITFGGGGHSKGILERISKKGRLYAFDTDPDANSNNIQDDRFMLINANFRYLKKFLRLYNIDKVDGILGDLGVSSYQFDTAERGFSLRFEGELDMRMSKNGKSAQEILQNYDAKQLTEILSNYGEITNAKALANAIIDARKTQPILTTFDLIKVCEKFAYGKKVKYYAQVFQAIRIEVNEEIDALHEFLTQSVSALKTGGKLVVLTYHSLEDRPVKNFIKTGTFDGNINKDMFGNFETPYIAFPKKPILPTNEEINLNNRSRSAKLRIAVKK
jgi:16S rRNA (cytosine1402-N4)-methyltransferase